MPNRSHTAAVHHEQTELTIQQHDILAEPGSRERSREKGYAEEQVYESFEDYDALYGPDAYLGDQFLQTPTTRLETPLPPAESPLKFSAQAPGNESKEGLAALGLEVVLGDDVRQEYVHTAEELHSESLINLEQDANQAGRALPGP